MDHQRESMTMKITFVDIDSHLSSGVVEIFSNS